MAALVTTSILGTLAGTPGVPASASEGATHPSVPLAFTVNLPDRSSSNSARTLGAMAGNDVIIQAWPSQELDRSLEPGDTFKLHTVDATTAVESDQIAVHVEPSTLPAEYVTHDGLVDFDVQVRNDAEQWTKSTAVTARVVDTASGALWSDASVTDEDPARLSSGAGTTAPSVDLFESDEVSDECPDTEVPTEDCAPETPVSPLSHSSAGADPWDQCLVLGNEVELVASRNFWTNVGATFALKSDKHDSKAQMIYSSSRAHHTTAGIAGSLNGSSWERSGTKTVSDQWGKTFSSTSDYRSYRIEMRYGKYKVKKINQCTGYQEGHGYRWRPRYETGGAKSVSISRPKDYTRCTDQSPGPWYRTSSSAHAYEYSAGVAIKDYIGFNLKSESQYSTFKKYVYDIKGNNKMVCGNNDYPSKSRLQMLRYR